METVFFAVDPRDIIDFFATDRDIAGNSAFDILAHRIAVPSNRVGIQEHRTGGQKEKRRIKKEWQPP